MLSRPAGLFLLSICCALGVQAQAPARLRLDHFDVTTNNQCAGRGAGVDTKSTQPANNPVFTGTTKCLDTFDATISATTTSTLTLGFPPNIDGTYNEQRSQFVASSSVITSATNKVEMIAPKANGSIVGIGNGSLDCSGIFDNAFNAGFLGSKTVTVSQPSCIRYGTIEIARNGVQLGYMRTQSGGQSYQLTGLPNGGGNSALAPPAVGFTVDAYYVMETIQPTSLKIDHIEIVQAVQNTENEAILVRGKETVVRVFVKTAGVELTNINGTATVKGKSLARIPTETIARSVVNLVDARSSLNFLLPQSLIGADKSVTVDVEAQAGSQTLVKGSLTLPIAEARWPERFRIGYAPVCFSDESAPNSPPDCPGAIPAFEAARLDAFLPASRTIVYPLLMPRLVIPSTLPGGADADGIVTVFMVRAYFQNRYLVTDVLTDVLGIPVPTPDQVVFVLPQLTSAESQNREFGEDDQRYELFNADETFGTPGGIFGQFWWVREREAREQDQPMSHSIAHGIGHNVGLAHTGHSDYIQSDGTGWDHLQNRPVGFEEEIMEATRFQANWASVKDFNNFQNAGAPVVQADPSPRTDASRAAGVATNVLIISGSITKDGVTGTLDSGFQVTSTASTPASNPSGNTCLRFTGSSPASDYCFNTTVYKTAAKAYFAVAAPFPAGTTRVALRKGGTELTALTTGTAPQVTITSPLAGEVWQGTKKVKWTASSSNLTFNVQYSPNGGTTWIPLASYVTGLEHEFDTATILAGNNVLFRVVASSGISNTTATSAGIKVTSTAALSIPSTTVDFRNLTIGDSETKDIEIRNSGTGQMLVTVTAPTNVVFELRTDPLVVLNSNESAVVKVRFTPTAAGAQTGTLKINDQTVTLKGAGFTSTVGSISTTTTSLTFGNVQTGHSKDATLIIQNFGTAPITVNSATVTGTGFSITSAFPQTLAPGAQVDLTVRLASAVSGAQTGQLTINSTDPSRAQLQIPIGYTGVNGAVPVSSAEGVLNAASYKGGAVAPGEIITLFGTTLGPAAIATYQINGAIFSSNVAQTRVLFDGVPAPIIYVLDGQTSVIVPYSIAGNPTTQMVVEYQGRQSDPVTLQVTTVAPALFSSNATGTGNGAILNQDNTVNLPSNPEERGRVVVLFGTGEGATTPFGVDGQLANNAFPKPLYPVTAEVGGIPAEVLYYGAAPTLVSGVLQVNVKIPANAPTGNTPIVIKINGVPSQSGLTVAIK